MSLSTYMAGAGVMIGLLLLYLLLRSKKAEGAAEASAALVQGLDAETIKRTQAAAAEVSRDTQPADVEAALKNGSF